MLVEKSKVVLFDYTLKDDTGATLDSSEGRQPLAYLHGSGSIIPGLEKELTGKSAGDSFEVQIAPEQGYGQRNEALLQQVPREQFTQVDSIEVGMQFQVQTEAGPMIITVVEVDDENVTVDGNHRLAGMDLTFLITVREVRDPTPEELVHGHAHGPGGEQH